MSFIHRKSKAGKRNIPMSKQVMEILQEQRMAGQGKQQI